MDTKETALNQPMQKSAWIQTERLTLRAFEESDRDNALRLLGSAEIAKTYMLPDCEDQEATRKRFERLLQLSRSQEHFVYAIAREGEVIGFLNECGRDGASIELGYVVSPEQRGRGYAPEALRAAIEELFRMGYERVEAGYFEENAASRRVMEKCGMRRLDKEEQIDYRGRTHRCLYLAIDREEK